MQTLAWFDRKGMDVAEANPAAVRLLLQGTPLQRIPLSCMGISKSVGSSIDVLLQRTSAQLNMSAYIIGVDSEKNRQDPLTDSRCGDHTARYRIL